MNSDIFHPLRTELQLPPQMNDPFFYEAHPLCLEAISRAQPMIRELMKDETEGKMFGVLIVEGEDGVGFLTAYSGQIRGRSDWPGFVPPVFDYLQPDGYFKRHEAVITDINHLIAQLEENPDRLAALRDLEQARKEAAREFEAMRQEMFLARERRRTIRAQGNVSKEVEARLVGESQFQKAEFRRLKKHHAELIEARKARSDFYEEAISDMKAERRQLSDELQEWLFGQFLMMNHEGQLRNLIDIFSETSLRFPPAGAGECCEPKLLQYAFSHELRPVQMAMFWVGPSPKVEIRHDGHFYPACRGKCLPILRWMLGSENVDNPRNAASVLGPETSSSASDRPQELPIVYEDDALVVVNKPAGLLSVPGISEYYSVWTIMRHRYPDTDSPQLVHRLDQPTSGLLLVAKTRKAHAKLQRQFMERTIKKRYVALLEHNMGSSETIGDTPAEPITISLPLYSDPLNRPYQSVDHERGKQAVTRVEVLGSTNGHARVALYPQTGRTHQLRVHCAHPLGLANPILGDQLYGRQQARRLYLHAESISFLHPETGQPMHFSIAPDF